MNFWLPDNLRRVTQGRWLAPPADSARPLLGISTDTRHIHPGQIFLALRGEKFDAHDFLHQAADSGATLLIVHDADKAQKFLSQRKPTGSAATAVLEVPDTLVALQQLATAYRDELRRRNCTVIAVAGSNGKTTTRNLIHTLLSTQLQGSQSPKSFNNHIGVPLTLLAAGVSSETSELPADFVVVEVGTNHPGELAALGAIVQPDVCVITSIGHEHMEFFKTLEGVAAEETSILPFTASNGLLVIDGDEPLLKNVTSHGPALLRFGASSSCDLRVSNIREQAHGSSFTLTQGSVEAESRVDFFVPLLGRHNAHNAAAAIAIARWMDLDDATISQGLRGAKPVEMRLVVRTLGAGEQSIVLINDAYNANPTSMVAALKTLVTQPAPESSGRHVAILGDMRELGEAGPDLHRQVGRQLAELRDPACVDLAIFVGRLAMFMAEPLAKAWPADRIHFFAIDDKDLPTKVAQLLSPGDVVLLKASRGVGLEKLVPAIEARFK